MLLQADGLSYSPRNLSIINQVDLNIAKGQVLMIVGPNGAGKSTLLSLLAKENDPNSGQIWLKQQQLENWKEKDLARTKAKFSQEHNPSIELTVKEIVLMGRYPYFKSHPLQSDLEIADRVMKALEVDTLKNHNYNYLSGGEKQRVHLARVFAQLENSVHHKIGFFDEPLNNLDVRHQYRVLEQIKNFAEKGNAAVVVLHDLNLAAEFADQVLLMRKGKVLVQGNPSEVFKEEWIFKAYDFPCTVMKNPMTKCPMILFRN